MSETFSLEIGRVPVLVSFPHDGVEIPPELERRMTAQALRRPDTDWHVAELYSFVRELGPSLIRPRYSRYVVDLNRDPDGVDLYPGADNTGVVPLTTFAREPIYRVAEEPNQDETAERIQRWFRPYHRALHAEMARLIDTFGVAVVFDAHSIRSVVPRFFEGVLPDLNLGTAAGRSAAPALADRAWAAVLGESPESPESPGSPGSPGSSGSPGSPGYTRVRDGRFKGGYITRHYGRPSERAHALQLELAQKNYMREEFPYEIDWTLASRLRPVLQRFVRALIEWASENTTK